MSETSLLVKIDGSQAASSASNLDSTLARLEAAGIQVAGAFDRLTAETQKSAAAMATALQSASAYERGVQRTASTQQAASQQSASFIRQLEMQIATFGKTREEVLRLEAAQLRLTTTSYEPLIKQLEQLREAQRRANQEMLEAANRESFVTSLREQSETYGMTTSQVLAYRAAQLGVEQESQQFIARIRAQEAAQMRANDVMRVGTLSAGEYRNAMRMLPAQITDIVTSLASGMPAYLVLIQQGGQLRDSFGGVGGAAKALLGAISPLALGLGTLAAATAAVLYGFKAGQDEFEDLNRQLILTGNYAGTTASQLQLMASRISDSVGTQGDAARALSALVATGQVGGDNLQYFAESAVLAERTLGVSTEKIVDNFADLGREPLQASLRLDAALHYLTASTLRQIQVLTDQGRTTDAARIAQTAYADALNQRAPEMESHIGAISKAWREVKDMISGAKSALLEFGRESDAQELARLQAARGSRPLGSGYPSEAAANDPADISALYERNEMMRADAREQVLMDRQLAESNRAREGRQNAINEAGKQGALIYADFYKESLTGAQRYSQQLQILDDAIQKMTAAGIEPDKSQVAQIRAMLADSLLPSTLDARVSAVQQAMQSQVQAIQDADRLVEAQHSARLVSDTAYYDALISNVQRSSSAQVVALNAEIALLEKEPAFGEKAIQNRQRIAESTAEIARIQSSATTQTRVLQIQSQEAAEAIRRSFERARESAQNYLDTLGRSYQRQLDDYGSGPAARRYSQGRNSIDDSYMQQEQQLQMERIAHPERSEQYDQQLKLIQEFHKKAGEQWDNYYRRIEEKQSDFSAGLRESVLSWIDANRNVGVSLGDDLTSAFGSATRSATELAAANALWGEGGEEAAKAIGRQLITSVVAGFIQAGLQASALYLLQQTGIIAVQATEATAETASTATSVAAITAQTAASVAAAAIVASAWAPAAAAVSLASFGANAAAAAAGIATTYSLTQGLAMTSMLPGYEDGGFTGWMARNQIAGFVHGQEYVVNAEATAKNRPMLEAMNRGLEIPAWAGTPMASQQPAISASAPPKIINNAPGLNLSWLNGLLTIDMVPELRALLVGDARAASLDDARFNGPVTKASNSRSGNRRLPRVASAR